MFSFLHSGPLSYVLAPAASTSASTPPSSPDRSAKSLAGEAAPAIVVETPPASSSIAGSAAPGGSDLFDSDRFELSSPSPMRASDRSKWEQEREERHTAAPCATPSKSEVVETAAYTAMGIASPTREWEVVKTMFNLCCKTRPADEGRRGKLVKKVEKALNSAKSSGLNVCRAYSSNLSPMIPDGSTLAHSCCKYGNAEVLELLVVREPRLGRLVNLQGMTPLHVAAEHGSKDCVDALLNLVYGERDMPVGELAPVDLAGNTPCSLVDDCDNDLFWKLCSRGDFAVFPNGNGGGDASVSWYGVRGRRKTMEDVLTINRMEGEVVIGVYDGHGGTQVAEHCAKEFEDMVGEGRRDWEEMCVIVDAKGSEMNLEGGSTATIVSVANGVIKCCNVGDSRAILIRVSEDGCVTTEAISVVVSPDDKGEIDRVANSGMIVSEGRVEKSPRESVGMSRAFGDYDYKSNASLPFREQAIIAKGEMWEGESSGGGRWGIVAACDGLWDVMSGDEVGVMCYEISMGRGGGVEGICEDLCWEAVRRGSKDNVTAAFLKVE